MASRLKLPPYVHAFVDRHGKPRYYLRRPGYKRVALPGLPWSPEFMAAHATALSGSFIKPEVAADRTKPGTVNAAIVGYYSCLAFRSLAPGTQRARRAILERLRQKNGANQIAQMPTDFILKLLQQKRPVAARNWLKALRGLIQFAVANELMPEDPTERIKLPRYKTNGIHSWTEQEIEQFQARHPLGTRARLALALLLYTAQRRGDVLHMGRQHVRDELISVRQQKTGANLQIPVHPSLREVLDSTAANHLTFLVTERGVPFSEAGFGNWFRERCDEAGLQRCSAHGLRKAACRRLAEAGCTEKQIAAISGHISLSEVQRYTKAADQVRLARDAMSSVVGAFPEDKIGTSDGKPEDGLAKKRR